MCALTNGDAQKLGGDCPGNFTISNARSWANRDGKICHAGWASLNRSRSIGAIHAQGEAATAAREATLPSSSGRGGNKNGNKDHLVIRTPAPGPLASVTATLSSFLPPRALAVTTEPASTANVSSVSAISHFFQQFTWLGADSFSPAVSRAFHPGHPFASVAGAAATAAAPVPAMLPSLSSASANTATAVAAAAAAKAEVGRATWTLLHTLAAQFPDRPTRRQQRDARTLVDCLTRIYPCGDCARHFAELVRRDPPVVSSGTAFRRWLCQVHNRVNARLGKTPFNCDLVESRWAPLGCSAAEAAAGEEMEGERGLVMEASGSRRAGCELLGVGSKGSQRRRGGWEG
ncbi:hypothetical protein Vretimale_11420 [Volvox reticuliferus]|uniref:Sulfhydryl oxidase n=1 Tax=Volvox reticuliferus TaxID=1737510 RepID=A0A8J4FP48_9CHLO|nr:hypothetical protein Vretifemale_11996 [Volvox reticuliferus]GIM07212.1 hypothetical protein Vretimale_11420 [Volvox reticuliferus]